MENQGVKPLKAIGFYDFFVNAKSMPKLVQYYENVRPYSLIVHQIKIFALLANITRKTNISMYIVPTAI